MLTREQGVEAIEQVAPVLLGQILVLHRVGRLTQTPLQPRLAFGRVQRFGLDLAAEQHLGEGPRRRHRLTQGGRPAIAQDVVRILPALQQGEAERFARLQQRQRPLDRTIGGAQARRISVKAQHRLGRDAPQTLHLFFGQGRAHRRDRRQARPLAGDDVHIAFDDDDALLAPALGTHDPPCFRQAVKGRPLVKQGGLRPVQIFGPIVGVHRPAAEADDAPARVQDREHQPVAEAVIGLAAPFRRDQHPRLDQIARPRPALDQRLLQPLAVVGRITQAETLPLVLRQAALFQIFARRLADAAAQIGGEPLLGQVHPVGQTLTLLLALGGLRVFGRKLHPRLARQTADRLDEAEALRLLQEADDVAVLARAEVVEETLVVIDEEAGRLLLREGAQADELASLTLELHRPPDDVGRPKAGLQLLNEPFVKSHA
ncbi:hypothetical protein BDIM_24180 [Brevundimonas diminuta ATCC 11568]|nr:hypothetical protein BDIM_24180 [Brevundimonas diminuta ATCC 11568]